jgi:hypothetical protein
VKDAGRRTIAYAFACGKGASLSWPVPRRIVRNSGPFGSSAMPVSVEHRQRKGLNNRAENSHQPTRVREKVMRRFKPARHLQRFASVHDQVANLFMHCRYYTDVKQKRALRTQAIEAWESVTRAPMLECLAAYVSYPYVLRVRPHVGQQVDSTVPGVANRFTRDMGEPKAVSRY